MPDEWSSAAKIVLATRDALRSSGAFPLDPQPAHLIGTSYWDLNGIYAGLPLPRTGPRRAQRNRRVANMKRNTAQQHGGLGPKGARRAQSNGRKTLRERDTGWLP